MRPEHKRTFSLLVDWQLMGLCIEREASGEPTVGRIAVGTVILERVDHRDWDGKNIREVILKPWQFSWTMPEAGEAYYNKSYAIASDWVYHYAHMPALYECCQISIGMICKEIPRDPDLAAVHCTEYVAGYYRKHMDEHPEEKCNRWWQKMKLIKTIGGHEFYQRQG